jgi:hypothetical protein
LFNFALGRLHLSPIGPKPQNVLDIATGLETAAPIFHVSNLTSNSGTGNWAIDFGKEWNFVQE